ncbi:MAG: HEAT repeat domain-containing protein [Myxococcales bacterium]
MGWVIRLSLCGCLLGATLAGAGSARAQAPAPAQVPGGQNEEAFRSALERLKSPNAADRASAADEMGRRGYRVRHEIANVLRPLLKSDPEPLVRAAAGRALGRLGVRDAVPDLIAALEDKSPDVRVVAAAALWRLPDPSAIDALVRHLSDSEPAVREWSVQALGVIGEPRVTHDVIRLLSDPVRSVRVSAVLSLGRIGDPAALEPLVQYVSKGERDDEEKAEVTNSIAAIKSPQKSDALFKLLAAANQDQAQRLRLIAALGQVGTSDATPKLRPYAAPGSPPSVRKAANEAIASIVARAQASKTSDGAQAKPK